MFLALAAGDGGENVISGGMDAVMSGIDIVIQLTGKVWTLMTSNPLLTVYVAGSLIFVGVSVFRSLRNSARR